MSNNKFRLVTRSDFDGLGCAVLLKELDLIEEKKFVHPKDMQDGMVLISDSDIKEIQCFIMFFSDCGIPRYSMSFSTSRKQHVL